MTPWALFVDGTDRTDDTDARTIRAESMAHAQFGTLNLVIRDDAKNMPIALDQELVLVAQVEGGGSTTLASSSSIGATNIKVASVAGFAAGDEMVVGSHPTAELRTISTVGTAGSGGTGITFAPALDNAHASGQQVYEAQRLFAGTIRHRVRRQAASSREHVITARDYTELLSQDVIDVSFRSVDESDKARVEWLISTWGAKGVTAGAEVQQTVANMPLGSDGSSQQDFSGKSVERALQQIEAITSASHYVDTKKRLHYFLTEANAAPFGLSDDPNGTTTFGYSGFLLPEDSIEKVNAVYIYGAELDGGGQIRGWRPDPPPSAATRKAVAIRDPLITSTAQLNQVGDAYLAAHASAFQDGTLLIRKPGLLAGMQVQITNAAWGLAAVTFTVSSVVMWMDENQTPVYQVGFGDRHPSMARTVSGVAGVASAAQVTAQAVSDSIADLSAAGANQVANSSMESASGSAWSVGSLWTYGYTPTGGEVAFAGTKVSRVVCAGSASGQLLASPYIAVDRLDDWWVSYWSFMRSYTAGVARGRLVEYDVAFATLQTTTIGSDATAVDTDWTRRSLHLGPTAGLGRVAFHASTKYVRVFFQAITTPTLTWDVDGVQVERGGLLTAYAPAPQELVDGQIGTTQIADDAITTPKLVAGSVVTGKLAASAVTANEINAGAVTTDKLAAGAVTADKIEAAAVRIGHLNDSLDNLLPNAGFEKADASYDSGARGWIVAAGTASDVNRGTFNPRSGLAKLRVRHNSNTTATKRVDAEDYIPVTGGGKYVIKSYVAGSGSNSTILAVRQRIVEYDADLVQIVATSGSDQSVPVSTAYNAISRTKTLDATAAFVKIGLQLQGGIGAIDDEANFDDVEFYRIDNDLDHAGGDVLINSAGMAITNGKITVTNPGSTVVIDGTSNMFKIAATGTLSETSAANNAGEWSSVTLTALAFSATPAFLAAIGTASSSTSSRTLALLRNPRPVLFGSGTSGGSPTSDFVSAETEFDVSVNLVGDDPVVIFGGINRQNVSVTWHCRYYVLQETAI